MNKFRFLLIIIMLLFKNFVLGQGLSTDDKLRISLNNALILSGIYFSSYTDDVIISSDSDNLNNDISLFVLRHYPVSALIGHTIAISTDSYTNKWGKDMLLDFIRLRYVVTIEKDNDSSRYKLIVFWGKQKPNNVLYSITFGESPMEAYEYCWYEKVNQKDNKKIIKLIRSADGLLRPNVFDKRGSLDSTLPPIILDGYGRLTQWNPNTRNVLTITGAYEYNTYTNEHNIATQRYQQTIYSRIINNNSGFRLFRGNNIYDFKRGHIDEVEYFDMSKPDNTKETGIQNICRIYIHKDRDDICKGRNFRHGNSLLAPQCITKKQWDNYLQEEAAKEQHEKEELRKKEEERLKKERLQRDAAERKREALYGPKIATIETNNLKIKRFKVDYPDIYSAYLTYVRLTAAISRTYPCTNLMEQPLEYWSIDQLVDYIKIQNKTLALLNDEKKCKKLKRTLKKASTNTAQILAFTNFANLPMISMRG